MVSIPEIIAVMSCGFVLCWSDLCRASFGRSRPDDWKGLSECGEGHLAGSGKTHVYTTCRWNVHMAPMPKQVQDKKAVQQGRSERRGEAYASVR